MRPALALGRLDAIASKILRHAEILAKRLAAEWPSDVYAKIISVISSQLRQIADYTSSRARGEGRPQSGEFLDKINRIYKITNERE